MLRVQELPRKLLESYQAFKQAPNGSPRHHHQRRRDSSLDRYVRDSSFCSGVSLFQ